MVIVLDDPCGIAYRYAVIRNVFGHHAAGPYLASLPDMYPRYDYRVGPDMAVLSYDDLFFYQGLYGGVAFPIRIAMVESGDEDVLP